jgi:peptidoglycan L-alanyl-D-glutamate endopeptidase CwlK
MIDKITETRILQLHPKIRNEVMELYREDVVKSIGAVCRFTSTYRSIEEQNEIYARGRTKLFDSNGKRLGIVTKARGGQSYHQYGLAFDFCLISKGAASWDTMIDYDKDGKSDWHEVASIFKAKGYEWGGEWKFRDFPHIQKTFGYTTKQLLEKYKSGDTFVENGITYVNL